MDLINVLYLNQPRKQIWSQNITPLSINQKHAPAPKGFFQIEITPFSSQFDIWDDLIGLHVYNF